MSQLLSLIRPDLQNFAGYSSASREYKGPAPRIKMDANECPWQPFGPIGQFCPINLYLDGQDEAIRARMAAIWNVNVDQVFVSAGSDQSIDCLIRLFCRPGQDEILVCPPTFLMYGVYAKLQSAAVLSVPQTADGKLDLAAIEKTATNNTKLFFIPAPNAPTGRPMDKDDLRALCKMRDGKSAIVIDEAYAEFSNDPNGFVPELKTIPNLLVLRTLSKAYGLAGERVGSTLGAPEIIERLGRVVPPYPIAKSAQRATLDALSPVGLVTSRKYREIIRQERARLLQELPKSDLVDFIYPSQGNFLMVITKDATEFCRRLAVFDILPRNMDGAMKGAVRISVSAPKQNDLLLESLGIAVEKPSKSLRFASKLRETKETKIAVTLDLDDTAPIEVKTGIGFFDHMIEQIAAHGGFALSLSAQGDLHVDEHHTIEDCALALGEALRAALGGKEGLARYGFTAPLDESLARVALDLSGRPFLALQAEWPKTSTDGMSPDLVEHFFRSFATALGATLHIEVKGENRHHMIEACFKALGRALRDATSVQGDALPSTKGSL